MKIFAIITGILTAILGCFAIAMPLRTFLGIGWILGALVLVNGITGAITAFSKKNDVWQGVFSILIAIGGGVILFNTFSRVMTDMFLAYIAGFVIIVYGVNSIISAISRLKESTAMGVIGIICGVLSVFAGVFSIMHPVFTMISLGYIIGFSVIMQGVNMIVIACSVKKAAE